MKSGLKITTTWDKYQIEVTEQTQKQCLDYLFDPIFPGLNRLFTLSFEGNVVGTKYTRYIATTAEIKDYNLMIHENSFFYMLVKKGHEQILTIKN